MASSGTQYGKTPFFWAAENGHAAVAELLLNRGASVDVATTVGALFSFVQRISLQWCWFSILHL